MLRVNAYLLPLIDDVIYYGVKAENDENSDENVIYAAYVGHFKELSENGKI